MVRKKLTYNTVPRTETEAHQAPENQESDETSLLIKRGRKYLSTFSQFESPKKKTQKVIKEKNESPQKEPREVIKEKNNEKLQKAIKKGNPYRVFLLSNLAKKSNKEIEKDNSERESCPLEFSQPYIL